MKKVCFFLALLLTCTPAFAVDHSDDLLSLVSLTTQVITPGKVTAVLGKPLKVEENKKRRWWYYSRGNANMIVCWNKKSESLEKVSFTSGEQVKNTLDANISRQLRSGYTDLSQAMKLLGTPRDMVIKLSTQELHYAFRNNVLRLFFRHRTLVDYCLY